MAATIINSRGHYPVIWISGTFKFKTRAEQYFDAFHWNFCLSIGWVGWSVRQSISVTLRIANSWLLVLSLNCRRKPLHWRAVAFSVHYILELERVLMVHDGHSGRQIPINWSFGIGVWLYERAFANLSQVGRGWTLLSQNARVSRRQSLATIFLAAKPSKSPAGISNWRPM